MVWIKSILVTIALLLLTIGVVSTFSLVLSLAGETAFCVAATLGFICFFATMIRFSVFDED
jgi:hypothetical protein